MANEQLEQYLSDVDDDYFASYDQREASNEDIRFSAIEGAQWEGDLEEQFSNRPRYQVNKTSEAVRRFMGEYSASEIDIKFAPANADASDNDAKILKGLYLRDYRNSDGDEEEYYAIDEMARGGIGAWMLETEYEDDEDPEDTRQRIRWSHIPSASQTVIWDLNAKRASKSDAKRCTILLRYSKQAFEKEWPDAVPDNAYQPWDKAQFNWHEQDHVYVAKRYDVKYEKIKAFHYLNSFGQKRVYYKDKIKDVMDELMELGFKKTTEKTVKRRYVECSMFSGTAILEEPRRIVGKNIPVIPVWGWRVLTDGQEFYQGIVRDYKDPQRIFNMLFSRQVEHAATTSKRIPYVDPDQIAGYENLYAQAHLGNLSYLPMRSLKDKDGNIVSRGPGGYHEPPVPDQNARDIFALVQDDINQRNGGQTEAFNDLEASGAALKQVIQYAQMTKYALMMNISKAKKRCAQVYREMAAELYNEPMDVNLVGRDGSESSERLIKYVYDEDKEQVVALNDISKGKYDVAVTSGASFATERDSTREGAISLLEKIGPESVYGDLLISIIVENFDGVNVDTLKDFNRKQQLIKGYRKPENEEDEKIIQEAQAAQQAQAQSQPDLSALVQSEAMKNASEAALNQSKEILNLANADKSQAQAVEAIEKIGIDKARMALDALDKQQQQTVRNNANTGILG